LPLAEAFAVADAPVASAFPDLVEFDAPPLTLPVAVASAAAASVALDLPPLALFVAEADWLHVS
jgi:hypothetical protein